MPSYYCEKCMRYHTPRFRYYEEHKMYSSHQINTPFSLMHPMPNEIGGVLKPDLDRLRKDKRYFEAFYLAIRSSLQSGASMPKGRAERAIAARKVATGHLKEFVSFACECGEEVKGKKALEIIEESGRYVCPKCGSGTKPKLKPSERGVYRLEVLPHLPYDGEFDAEVSGFTRVERAAYRKLIGFLQGGDSGEACGHREHHALVKGQYKQQALAIGYTGVLRRSIFTAGHRHRVRMKTLVRMPLALLAWDIFRFLLIKPYRQRRYASIFPGLQPFPDRELLEATLNVLREEELMHAVQKLIDPSVIPLKCAPEVVLKKFEMEELLHEYLKLTSSRAVGGIVLYLHSDLELDAAARVVFSTIKELKEVLKIIIRLGMQDVIPEEKLENLEDMRGVRTSVKARQFLALVR